MTNDSDEPKIVQISLPRDTINYKSNRVLFAMMPADGAPHGIAHYLILDSEFGCYRFQLSDCAAASLLDQCISQHQFGLRLLKEEEGEEE